MKTGSRAVRGVISLVAAAALGGASASAERVVYARHLALSPDGATLAFSWAGDVWRVPAAGGAARRLTVNPADDERPVWSPDGSRIAFSSNRHGAPCVFVMSRDGDGVTRLTFGDAAETPTDWSPDGAYVYFQARKNGEVDWEPRTYRVPANGGEPVRVLNAGATNARVSPDGRLLAFNRGQSVWWRTGYRGSCNYDVWIHDQRSGEFRQFTDFDGTDWMPIWSGDGRELFYLSDRAGLHNVWRQALDGAPRQVTNVSGDRVRDYSVSRDGKTLAYAQWDRVFLASPPDGPAREIAIDAPSDSPAAAVQLETFTKEADELALSPDGKEFAVVVRGEIFVGQTEPDKLTRRVTNSAARDRDVSWSPDGKALFFVSDAAGQEDIYRAVSAEEPKKALGESLRFEVERVTDHPEREFAPTVAPDGAKLALVRGLGNLVVRDVKSGEEKTLLESWNTPQFRWSPDSKWIAYAAEDAEYNSDIWVVPADGSAAAVNISRHPDNDENPQWSADGQVLAFASRRQGFDSDLYLVFLSPALHERSNVDLVAYFKDAGEAAGKRKPLESAAASGTIALAGAAPASAPASSQASASQHAESELAAKDEDAPELTLEARLRSLIKELLKEPEKEKKDEEKKESARYEYELSTAWQRVRRVTSLADDQSVFALAPDGSLLAFNSRHEGEAGLFSIKWDGSELKKMTGGTAGAAQWDLTGKRLYYLAGGVPNSLSSSGGDKKTHGFTAKMAIDRSELARQKFDDAARMLGAWFYHPTLKGLDWPARTAKYRALALKTRTWAEFNEIFNLLQGELNGSHLGIFGPGGRGSEAVGYLGCEFDPAHAGPGLRVAKVLRNAPADRAESRLYPGDVILFVNDQAVGPDASIERALIDTVGDPVILRYLPSPTRPASKPADSQPASAPTTNRAESLPILSAPASAPAATQPAEQELVIRPASAAEFRRLQYEAWVAANRAYVDEKSGGKVAYVHISGMGEPQFYEFERDLYAVANGKDGLIIDVRNNGGGWTADWVMAVLNVRRHAYTVGRGGKPGYPQDRLIFYSWPKPVTMMCNQFSYSNAEIVSHAFKNLKRGPLVGMTTFGAVISTGAYSLVDGTVVRMPFRGWYTVPGGVDMENNGAEPDVKVPMTPADEQHARDPQLEAAVRATLEEIARSAAGGGS